MGDYEAMQPVPKDYVEKFWEETALDETSFRGLDSFDNLDDIIDIVRKLIQELDVEDTEDLPAPDTIDSRKAKYLASLSKIDVNGQFRDFAEQWLDFLNTYIEASNRKRKCKEIAFFMMRVLRDEPFTMHRRPSDCLNTLQNPQGMNVWKEKKAKIF